MASPSTLLAASMSSSSMLVQSPSTSACSSLTHHRLLYRGALSLPDSHMLLDGLSFFATSTTSSDEAEARKLLSNDLSLALETMRGRPSLRFLGLIDMKDVYVDHSGNVSVDVHPQALLSQIYFENVFCLNPLASTSQSSRGVKVSLGDTDGPETTQIVIYAQVAPGDNDRAIQLRVGRITTPPPPPSVKRLPRPDDPTPRVPPFQLNKHPRVRELKRAHTSADLGSGPAKKAKGDTFTVPALPTHKTMGGSSKGKVKARKSDEHEDEDVFGMLPSSNASTSKDSTLATRVDPEIEQGNKLLVKQTAIQYLTLGLSAPPPGSLLSDACGPCPSMAKTHERFKEILGYVYRGVLYALRSRLKTTPLDPQAVSQLVKAHIWMYVGAGSASLNVEASPSMVMREEV